MDISEMLVLMGFVGACFLAAATGGFGLVLNIFWQDRKSKQRSRRQSEDNW